MEDGKGTGKYKTIYENAVKLSVSNGVLNQYANTVAQESSGNKLESYALASAIYNLSKVISFIFLTFQITLFDSCQNNNIISKRQLDCVVDTVFTTGTNIKYLLNPIDSIALLNVKLKKYNSKTDTFFYSISDCRMIPKFIYHTTDELFLLAGSGSYRELYRYTIENKQVIKEITSFDFLNGEDYEYFYLPYLNKDYLYILMSNNLKEFCSINTKYGIKSTEITNITINSSKMIIEKQNKDTIRISLPTKIPIKFQ